MGSYSWSCWPGLVLRHIKWSADGCLVRLIRNCIAGLAFWEMRCIVHRLGVRTATVRRRANRRAARNLMLHLWTTSRRNGFQKTDRRHGKEIICCLNFICRRKTLISLRPTILTVSISLFARKMSRILDGQRISQPVNSLKLRMSFLKSSAARPKAPKFHDHRRWPIHLETIKILPNDCPRAK